MWVEHDGVGVMNTCTLINKRVTSWRVHELDDKKMQHSLRYEFVTAREELFTVLTLAVMRIRDYMSRVTRPDFSA
ncbi:uncharacterized protein IUM83_00350 [Phytophthora cinnamomi]|uniref:uncharacterized protein n=1 Tax=Phytophthora cinnamomi TaxID=4785 RepID=UPI00355A6659|nr:hypothetical protein IUM83_00350 [Phytophthora cinnamomi]